MRVAILAGGRGTRLQEETSTRPKPMVEIGGRPILWHIMKHYAQHGFKDFVIALGYMGEFVKRYFLDCYNLSGNLTIDFGRGGVSREEPESEDWLVNLVETGDSTLTGGRIKRLEPWLGDGAFMVTYGDGVSDVDLTALCQFHQSHGLLATVTAVRPPARFGGLILDDHLVADFTEKPSAGEGWINGGFLVFEPEVLQSIDGDRCSLESDVLQKLAAQRQLAAFRHHAFWQCMDTLRDKHYLESLWREECAPWRTWRRPRSGGADAAPELAATGSAWAA
jgi:glucose-1-phosphate cytidylyltransferase